MGSSGFRARRTDEAAALLGLLAACAACTTIEPPQSAAPAATRVTTSEPPAAPAFEAGVELPPGQGRDILVTECLICHELTAIELFKGFYTRDNWRQLVVSMRANGAQVDDVEIDVLSDYLAQHFGAGAR